MAREVTGEPPGESTGEFTEELKFASEPSVGFMSESTGACTTEPIGKFTSGFVGEPAAERTGELAAEFAFCGNVSCEARTRSGSGGKTSRTAFAMS
eukprot:2160933-Pleurochrysis_carterae.AAC.1